MDCRKALYILDSAAGFASDARWDVALALEISAAEVRAAQEHLASCPACAEIAERRQQLDRKVSSVMRDVVIPTDLRERLLNALAQTSEVAHRAEVVSVVRKAETTQLRHRSNRRFWIRLAMGMCAALFVAVFFWSHSKPTETDRLTLQDIRDRLPIDLVGLAPFQGDFEPDIPPDGWMSGAVRFDEEVVGFHRDPQGRHLAAVRTFSFRNRDGERIQGILITVPRSALEETPTAEYFSASGAMEYLRRNEQTFATVVWSHGDFAYVCFVPAENDALESLERALSLPPV